MEKTITRQRGRFMLYNLVTFTVIFALFASIIYSQIAMSLFSPVHQDLEEARRSVEESEGFVEDQIDFRFDNLQSEIKRNFHMQEPGEGDTPPEPEEFPPMEGNLINRKLRIPMRVQPVVRDSGGTVVNPHALGRVYWESILEEIPFSSGDLGKVTAHHLQDGSVFHSLSFSVNNREGEPYYVQLLTNVDGEQAIIENFVRMLVVFTAVFVLLSIAASYVLSRMSMRPLLRSWNRQTEFVGNASHELRTPLTIIQNKLESLLAAPQETILQRADDIAVSLSETRRLSKLTSDLMTLARADSNATQLEKETFALDELVRTVCEPYGELAELEEKTLSMQLECAGELAGDKARIHELMVILLDNALKYTRMGDKITVCTACREGRAMIEVMDTGIGIGEESEARIFERFYREEKARSRQNGGSGLGLSIAKWIVEAHGGTIRAYPNKPHGTVVQVRL